MKKRLLSCDALTKVQLYKDYFKALPQALEASGGREVMRLLEEKADQLRRNFT